MHSYVIEPRLTGGFSLWSKPQAGRKCLLGVYKSLKEAKLTARLLAGWRGKVIVKRRFADDN